MNYVLTDDVMNVIAFHFLGCYMKGDVELMKEVSYWTAAVRLLTLLTLRREVRIDTLTPDVLFQCA